MPRFLPLSHVRRDDAVLVERAEAFATLACQRRTVRQFASDPVPRQVLEACLRTAGSAPSGANRQPWHFVVVSDPDLKRQIRLAAEEEEREFYTSRAPRDWLDALAPFGTNADKPFLETAPHLIAIFAQSFNPDGEGRGKNYYVQESVGIATGLLIAALHQAGLVTLTHTPSPMGFLNPILGRPSTERPYLLLVVGHPAEDAVVPDIQRKPLETIVSWR